MSSEWLSSRQCYIGEGSLPGLLGADPFPCLFKTPRQFALDKVGQFASLRLGPEATP